MTTAIPIDPTNPMDAGGAMDGAGAFMDEYAEQHRQVGRGRMDAAERELERGELALASEWAWDAAAAFIKAAASQRGLPDEGHIQIAQSAGALASETANDEILILFDQVFALRHYFVDMWRADEYHVRMGVEAADKIIAILESAPPPADRPLYRIQQANGDWIMTYIPIGEHAEQYKQTGRWMMDKAEWEFRQGDLMQASEKAWGAAAHFLKAMAVLRGLNHDSHHHLVQIAGKLRKETGNDDIVLLFNTAESLHVNFYAARLDEDLVRLGLDKVQELLDILEAIPTPPLPRITHVQQRTFHRTRADG